MKGHRKQYEGRRERERERKRKWKKIRRKEHNNKAQVKKRGTENKRIKEGKKIDGKTI